jgi:hypothetical protein
MREISTEATARSPSTTPRSPPSVAESIHLDTSALPDGAISRTTDNVGPSSTSLEVGSQLSSWASTPDTLSGAQTIMPLELTTHPQPPGETSSLSSRTERVHWEHVDDYTLGGPNKSGELVPARGDRGAALADIGELTLFLLAILINDQLCNTRRERFLS